MSTELREALSAMQHEIWAHWMTYMFKQGHFRVLELDGTPQTVWIMPAELRQRWERQAKTSYSQLTEQEKESDREQADKVLTVLKEMDSS